MAAQRVRLRRLSVLVVWLATVSVALAGSGCHHSRRTNVLVITVDTLRADHLGCYGFAFAQTPAVDALARDGVRCTDAATSAPITLPAHCSIMTGLYPPAHGVRDNGNYALAPEAETLAERLRAVGYRTAAFVSAAVLARRYGLDQGFETYDDDFWSEDEPQLFMIRDRPASRTADRAVAWLDDWRTRTPTQPFFLWMHLFDPHQPYVVRASDLAAIAPTLYDAGIAQADRGVGQVLEWLAGAGLLDDTLVVFTADHGESLGEHGEPTHGIFVYDATVRVPLVWRLPRVLPAGTVYGGPVRHIDILPTMLAILGVAEGEPVQGVTLLPALQARVPPPDLPQYAEARLAEQGFGMAPLVALRHGGRKWIRAPRPELYDLHSDPNERVNLYPAQADEAGALAAELDAILEESSRRALVAPMQRIDTETEDMLRALGYLAGPEQRAEMAGMDPKDGMAIYATIESARSQAQAGHWDRVEALLAPVLVASPENVTARNVLALAAMQHGDLDEAERQYRASLSHQPRQPRIYGALGAVALRREQSDEAERLFHEALALAPGYVEAMSNLGFIDAMRGDQQGAERWYRQAIAVDPSYPHVYRRLADLFYERKDWTRALEYYRRVLASLPQHFEVLIQAGNSARFLSDPVTAAGYYETAARVRADSWIPPYNLACLRALQGDPDAALTLLATAAGLGFHAPELLEENPDFASLHGLASWAVITTRVRTEGGGAQHARNRAAAPDRAAGRDDVSGGTERQGRRTAQQP